MMKSPIFFTLAIIFFATALVPAVTGGYHAKVQRGIAAECRIWVTNNNGNYVAGNKHSHKCDNDSILDIDTLSNDTYWLNAHIAGSTRETKHRGPFNSDGVCYIIYGDAVNWHFTTWDWC